jgi:arylsulfatase A-like enzyme
VNCSRPLLALRHRVVCPGRPIFGYFATRKVIGTSPIRKALLAASFLVTGAQIEAKEGERRPNFLVIVADDLGYSDLGAFGGEIATPNLDELAKSGIRLANFHTAPACSPTRAMLLTGAESHRVGLGALPEVTQDNQRGKPGYEGYLHTNVPTIAERLRAAGYRTLFSGKWHVGVQPEHDPHARGFQRSFVLLNGGHNHFGHGLSTDPTKGATYRENGVTVTHLPADFYSTDYFGDKMIEQITSTKDGPDGNKPFFAYLAFTAPHFPLQAPTEVIAKYKGRYDRGFEALREQRMQRQRELGLMKSSTQPHAMVDTPTWADLSPAEQTVSARKMEIYAAMVNRLDEAVGRVIAALKATGEFDNTVVLFLSDNGAEGMDVTSASIAGIRDHARATEADIDRMGTATTFISYGNGWAQAATAPAWRVKGYATEGGTRSVAFLSGPVVRRPGTIAHTFLHVTDVVPTFLDIAGVRTPKGSHADPALPPLVGLSWTPLLKHGRTVYPADKTIATELFGSRSLRAGEWKITDISDGRWRLFNVVADPGETRDLSAQHPTRHAALIKAWDAYAATAGVVMPDPPMHSNPPKDLE